MFEVDFPSGLKTSRDVKGVTKLYCKASSTALSLFDFFCLGGKPGFWLSPLSSWRLACDSVCPSLRYCLMLRKAQSLSTKFSWLLLGCCFHLGGGTGRMQRFRGLLLRQILILLSNLLWRFPRMTTSTSSSSFPSLSLPAMTMSFPRLKGPKPLRAMLAVSTRSPT